MLPRFSPSSWALACAAAVALASWAAGCGGATTEAPPGAPPGAVASRPAASLDAGAPAAVAPTEGRKAAGPSPSSDVNGELVTMGNQRLLRVWGTPSQMGRAHGALLRQEILDIVDGYALDAIPPATLDAAGVLYTTVTHIPPRLKEEAQGVIDGMRGAGSIHVPRLDRELQAADLLVLNAMTDLLAIGCSSVSAWGSATLDASGLAGSPVLVRNLDWSEDPQLLGNQVIFVFEPDDPARQPVVSVAFAGYLGCLSCMNESGVAAFFNMGYGDGAASATQALRGFAPANLLLRDTLELRDVDGDGRSTAEDVEAAWRREQHAGSYMLHVVEPRRDGVAAPARVLEVEADAVVTRAAHHGEFGGQILAATNHLRDKTAPSECSRYTRIERTVAEQGHHLDRAALWRLGTELRLPQVVHTVMIEPEARSLSVWLRAPGQPARDDAQPVDHTWSTLVGTTTHR